MRVTRATQRAQQDGKEERETPEAFENHSRALKDIEPNTPLAAALAKEPLPARTAAKTPAKKGKGKTGRKGAKGKKAKTGEEPAQGGEEAEPQANAGVVYQSAVQGQIQVQTAGDAESPRDDEHTIKPQTPAIRRTRRHLAELEQEEALSKLQDAPPATEYAITVELTEQVAEQAETAAGVGLNTAPKAEPPITQEEPAAVATKTAPKPARRTRHQQAKLEEKQLVDAVTGNAAANATANTMAKVTKGSDGTDEFEHANEQNGTATGDQLSPQIKSEMATKPKRSTRRKQAKPEEEEREQTTPRCEPVDEIDEGLITEQATEAVGVEREASREEAETEAFKFEEPALPMPTADSQLSAKVELDFALREVVETRATPKESSESQACGNQVVDAATINEDVNGLIDAKPATPTDAEFGTDLVGQVNHQLLDETPTLVEFVSEAEPKMLCDEKPFETSMSTPTKNENSVRCSSRSSSKSPIRIEQSISAIDRLEEDLESIGTAIPDLGHSDDERSTRGSSVSTASKATTVKTPSKMLTETPVRASTQTPAKIASKTPSKTPINALAVTKASLASKKTAAIEAPLATRISRVPSANPKRVKPTTTSIARASSVRTVPSKDSRKPSTETADYLASKRRPNSVSFPTPPPPPKGRAPTKPIFHLSSDNVAARLRVQKEERLKREVESTAAPKQRPISMPRPAKSTKPATVPNFQLPGEATAARLKAQKEERLKRLEKAGGAEKPVTRHISMAPAPKSTKPVTKPNFQLPGEATAAKLKAQKEERLKRMAAAEAAKKAAPVASVGKSITHRPRESLLVKQTPGVSISLPSQADAPQRSTSLASMRTSITGPSVSRSTSTSSANRNSVLLAEGGKSTVTPMDAAALKSKGKQVFNRDKMEKETMERERREKEEAAKRARAEAAERGRIASREWAERQRKKLMGPH
ncbi:hypothetical protein SVAN01_09261 [Stagonosporopsis vannaccii]|nr:hypothetical protein SVAN01_09261 [Stagonosporopsis vannaccii]